MTWKLNVSEIVNNGTKHVLVEILTRNIKIIGSKFWREGRRWFTTRWADQRLAFDETQLYCLINISFHSNTRTNTEKLERWNVGNCHFKVEYFNVLPIKYNVRTAAKYSYKILIWWLSGIFLQYSYVYSCFYLWNTSKTCLIVVFNFDEKWQGLDQVVR